MKELLKAIRAALRGEVAIVALVPGGIYLDLAQTGASMPYLVWNHAGQFTTGFNTGDHQIEHHILRFRTFAPSIVTAADCFAEIEKLLVTTPPPALDAGTIMLILRESGMIALDPDLSTEGEEVWVSTLQLAVTMQRNPIA